MIQTLTPTGGDAQDAPETTNNSTDQLPRNQILLGDVRERLGQLPLASVDCVITSPPYFGVRDYGHDRQLGAEPAVDEWVQNLRSVCRGIARVLKPTGAMWLNLGDSYSCRPQEGAPQKSLLLGPSLVAQALVGDGWILRNQVIWAKSNPMPSSVRDRLSTTYELIYFFVRSRSYYFDLDAIREPLRTTTKRTANEPQRVYPPVSARQPARRVNDNRGLSRVRALGIAGHPLGKNPGDVWTLATAGFRGAHFAVFPASLVERPLLATCPSRMCVQCGRPWRRERQRRDGRLIAVGELQPSCRCAADSRPGVVLDPFFGTGTVGLVAERHGRDWLGIELNPVYAELAIQRLAQWRAKPKANQP